MNVLRASRYFNHVENGDGRSILYNGLTLCVDVAPTDYVTRLLDGGDFSFLSSEEMAHLEKRGHITAKSPDEEMEAFRKQVTLLISKYQERDSTNSHANLTLVLTYKCNLSCHYCYQQTLTKRSASPRMLAGFVDEIFSKHLDQLFPQAKKENVRLMLFGGEPLLPANRDVINHILAFARKHSITVYCPTNAMTLPAMVDLVGPGKISDVQVTLDGDRPLHDGQRIPRSGKPTFEKTIAAIHQLIARDANVFIRIHTHPGELRAIEPLIERLDREKILCDPKVEVYLAPMNDFVRENLTDDDHEVFGRLFQTLTIKTGRPPSLNMDFLDNIIGMQARTLIPRVRFCSLGIDTVRILDANGDIYGCYEEAGHLDRRIGSISGGKLEWFALNETYAQRNILNIPECLRCPVALFCGGGCPRQALLQHGTIFSPYCLQNREFIAQTMKAYFHIRATTSKIGGRSPGLIPE